MTTHTLTAIFKIPYKDKDLAQELGARWNMEYWGSSENADIEALKKRWPLISEIKVKNDLLLGESAIFGGSDICFDFVPSLFNIKEVIPSFQWKQVRDLVVNRFSSRCEICGERQKVLNGVDFHIYPRWQFNEENKKQELKRIICLCPQCFCVLNYNFTKESMKRVAKRHYIRISKVDVVEMNQNINHCFKILKDREKIDWSLDLSILENSGIKATINI